MLSRTMGGYRRLAFLSIVVIFAAAIALYSRSAADAPASSDIAVIESYTQLAVRGQLLVGAYSRFQWHHPGPLPFYLLLPFYVAAGFRTAGLYAGASVLSVAAIALIGTTLARRRPTLAAATCAALALFAWRAAEATASPWNPHVAVLPMTALVVTAADVLAGNWAMLPVVALLASFAGQAHVALLPCALVLGAAAALRVIAAARSSSSSRSAMRSLAAAVVVLAIAWALPIYEQLTASPRGNLTELWRFFAAQTRPGQPFAAALSAWADMIVGPLRPDFYPAHGWPFVESPVRWAEALSLALCAAAAIRGLIAFRQRDHFIAALSTLLLAAAAIALWSATRIDERIFDHDVFWIAGIGTLLLALAADSLVSLLWRSGTSQLAPALAMILTIVAAVASARYVAQVVASSFHPPAEALRAGELAADLEAYMRRERIARPLIKIDQDAWPFAAGAILALQKQGMAAAVEDDWIVMFTPAFRATGREDAVVTVAAPAEHLRLRDRGARLISAHDPVYAYAEAVRR